MFAIGDREWPGVSKILEEIGELGQVLGKLMQSRGKFGHWSGNLSNGIHDEIADVIAACSFVIKFCKLDNTRIAARVAAKLELFERWHREDNEPG